MRAKSATAYRQWSYRELDASDWYLHVFEALGEAAEVYATHGYEERRVYAVFQVESSLIAYAVYFPQMARLGIQAGDDLYWSDDVFDLPHALDAWVQSPETWANLLRAKDNHL